MPGSDGALNPAIAREGTQGAVAPVSCVCCGIPSVEVLLDFGPQPPSNRFVRPDAPDEEAHPLVVGQCPECGLIQLIDPMPFSMVKSHFDWVAYNEPEGHLDELVARLRGLPGLSPDSRITGLTYKDDSTLARFNRAGYVNTFRYDLAADLGLGDPCAGLESVQAALSESLASGLAARHGLGAVAKLVKPGGYLVFELPDCTKFVRACDYSFIWEEHIAYFSSHTLSKLVHNAGLMIHETKLYPYPLEDSLVGVVRNQPPGTQPAVREGLEAALGEGRNFAERFSGLRERLQTAFRSWRERGKRTAIFGAGHLAAKFVNLFSLSEWLECIVDDNPRKQLLLMPGSRLPIVGSAALGSGAIDLCLLSLNPESEQKVLAKNRAFVERGGQFLSIFALSPRTVYKVPIS
jgi:hypothetical protein